MGYLYSTIEAVKMLMEKHKVRSICDLGDQINYTSHKQPEPYVSEWYKLFNVDYMSIDLNGNNDSKQWDMSEPIKTNKKFDLVVDAGFSEHVKDLYQCYANIDKLTKVGGFVLHENPRTKNWPSHCRHYMDEKFHVDFAIQSGYHIVELKNTVSAHNYETGNNVFCLYQKKKEGFIEREQFPQSYAI